MLISKELWLTLRMLKKITSTDLFRSFLLEGDVNTRLFKCLH